ncbi:tRNA threonylcarbamoyladenosine biosynthesis protein RimN [Marinobacter halodurans]|uniref:Threonylcarbamoyl-AMP synthase n=1 Tax=Marinobacter halodurans TaxID=2528979 RepID=A0ABY1ZL96_9GAMM|nr:Sua5/YciO/YrdC/YwlC family protein [Marinobacter halodurans]TBW56471.1 tRNA threonylcarbamoyladenosine biosynthesis protein RimN [Marinobacter halodurans]
MNESQLNPNDYPPGWWHLRESAAVLEAGGVIAYPTEAVWGLGCDPWDGAAVDRLLALKDRPQHKGVILAAATPAQVAFLLDPLEPALRERALSHWPGPVTCLIPDVHDQIPEWIKGEHSAVAIRVSDHPLVRRLCMAVGGPVVSTSCNPAGRPPARSRLQVARYFEDCLDYILPGALGGQRQPSRIIDLVSGRQLR